MSDTDDYTLDPENRNNFLKSLLPTNNVAYMDGSPIYHWLVWGYDKGIIKTFPSGGDKITQFSVKPVKVELTDCGIEYIKFLNL